MKKILIVTTVSISYIFFLEQIRHLLDTGYEVHCAGNFSDHHHENDLITLGATVHHVNFSRSVSIASYRQSYAAMKRLLRQTKFDMVHCHTPNAAVITRLACRKYRKQGLAVLYTAHGFHFYHGAPIINWLLYYPVEWLCSFFTDTLITINTEDQRLAQKHMHAKQIAYVPGIGINPAKFQTPDIDRVAKRESLGIPQDATVLLSIGEMNENKNHRTVLQAIQGLDVYYLLAGDGVLEAELKAAAAQTGLQDRVKFLGYRKDIPDLLAIADIFVLPSYREGLSVSLMEAMAAGKPLVASRIRGNTDLCDANGGALFDPHSAAQCRVAIQAVRNADWARMADYNRQKIRQFTTEQVRQKLDAIYGAYGR